MVDGEVKMAGFGGIAGADRVSASIAIGSNGGGWSVQSLAWRQQASRWLCAAARRRPVDGDDGSGAEGDGCSGKKGHRGCGALLICT